jgi:hypothetical protein
MRKQFIYIIWNLYGQTSYDASATRGSLESWKSIGYFVSTIFIKNVM